MIRLVPFEPATAPTVATWATGEVDVMHWCSRHEAPVPVAVIAGWSHADDVAAYTLYEGARLVGYGELWIDDDEAEVELARLIVDPERRGRGYGRRLAHELTLRAQEHHGTVALRVHPGNHAARRCYASAGFTRVDPAVESGWNASQPVAYVWMTHLRVRGSDEGEVASGDEGPATTR